MELEPGVSSAEVQAESERAQLKLPLKGAKKHPGRQELLAHLPRIEKIIACTPEQCVCGNCGKENSVIGYEKSEQLDVKPAEYFVVVTKREKRACKDCEELAGALCVTGLAGPGITERNPRPWGRTERTLRQRCSAGPGRA